MNEYFVDVHNHMLPGVDDGANSLEQTCLMLKLSYEEGVRELVMTPHFGAYNRKFDQEEARKKFLQVKQKTAAMYPEMKLYLGSEIFYDSETVRMLNCEKAMTIAETDYVLIEFYPDESIDFIKNAVLTLVRSGYRPIIAHAERYQYLRKNPEKTADLIEAGARIQINSGSLTGGRFDGRYRYVKKILGSGYVHLMGSDCHDDSIRRPAMREAAMKIVQLQGKEIMEIICRKNPQKMIKNQSIEPVCRNKEGNQY